MQVKAVLLIRRKRMTSSFSPTAGKSREEEDLLQRSKKKVRSWEVGENGSSLDDADGTPSFKQVVGDSYKEKLLNIFGGEVPEKQDFKNLEPPPAAAASGDGSGTGLVIPLSDEEWQQWSKPWQRTLVTKVLGKTVSFWALESFLQRRWIRTGTIKIVDMADGFFLVYFSSDEDYNHALYEGP